MVLMPKSFVDKWVRTFAMLLGMLYISLVNLLRILSSFRMSGLEKGVA